MHVQSIPPSSKLRRLAVYGLCPQPRGERCNSRGGIRLRRTPLATRRSGIVEIHLPVATSGTHHTRTSTHSVHTQRNYHSAQLEQEKDTNAVCRSVAARRMRCARQALQKCRTATVERRSGAAHSADHTWLPYRMAPCSCASQE